MDVSLSVALTLDLQNEVRSIVISNCYQRHLGNIAKTPDASQTNAKAFEYWKLEKLVSKSGGDPTFCPSFRRILGAARMFTGCSPKSEHSALTGNQAEMIGIKMSSSLSQFSETGSNRGRFVDLDSPLAL